MTVAGAGSARAQAKPERSRLLVTVADPSGAVIPNARVTVTAVDAGATAAATPAGPRTATTADTGVATIGDLAPGRYTIQAEFPGFETVTIRDFRVRAGDNKRSIALPLKKVAEEVNVGRDGQSAGLDPRGNAFSTVLTREQIEALPDDPDEMEAALKAMAPPGAQMRIDGFTGGKLPPKSQIRSIRLPRMDHMAAQNHGGIGGMMFIDILTQPGQGPIRTSLDFSFRDESLNAQNPFTPTKGDEGLQQPGFSIGGAVVPNTSSFSFSMQRANIQNANSLLAATPDGTLARPVEQPATRYNINARFDQAINAAHMLRFSYQRSELENRFLGVGGYDLDPRAFDSQTTENIFRVSENGAVGRRFFSESRLQVRWSDSIARSYVELPTLRVLDSFTTGGAQRRGGSRNLDIEAATDLDYVRGAHSMRAGVLLEAGRYRSDDFTNYLGTYTFANLADYEANRPSNYTRRIGDPHIEYSNVQFGAYVQDDYRLTRSLLVSYGVRYEAQSLLDDQLNFSPRITVSWSPRKSGSTTIRAGWGYFTDWLPASTWEQTLRFDGFRQREINVQDPAFPIVSDDSGQTPPSNRYLLDDDLDLSNSQSANAGIDQQFGQAVRLSASYTYRRGVGVLRGRNLNVPVDGVRPFPEFANVIEVVGDAASRVHSLNFVASVVKMNWRSTFLAANYSFSSSESNSTGAFSLPASGDDLTGEWGLMAPRHRFGGSFNTRPFASFGVAVNFRGQSGSPYNQTTGFDDNLDGVFNDRLPGVPRNSLLTDMQWDLGVRLSYTIGFGTRPQQAGGPGGATVVMIGGAGGGMPGGAFGGGANDKRVRVEFYAAAQNVTNNNNFVGYSGVLTSPFYGQPTNVLNPRKIELGVRVGF
ncbi:MAG TPA: carboxypeptidase regulatory-like domain-containing protein [Vicinamibacterales bacterium]|nr:carboxypeptidase regulatory-like domain-containing protein [Vicinamibacterales bacterium]